MADKLYISSITLPSGSTYDIKDAEAREMIEALQGYTEYLGVTTTELVDGVTTSPVVVIAGESVTAKKGDIVTYESKEFVYNGTVWQEFGDLSGLGDLAFKDTASADYTPEGTVTISVATSTNETAAVAPAQSGEVTYTPAGSVSLTQTEKTLLISPAQSGDATYTPAGSVSLATSEKTVEVSAGVGDTNYTPAGSVSLTQTEKTLEVAAAASGAATYTPAGSVSLSTSEKTLEIAPAQSGEATYTPAGSVSVSVTPDTDSTSVTPITDVGTLPSYTLPTLSTSVANETLTIGFDQGTFSAGTLPTKGTAVEVVTGISSASGTFSGTGARLVAAVETPDSASFSGTGARLETAVTTTDSAAFSGTGVHLEGAVDTADSASFSGTGARLAAAVSTVDSASFNGTGVRLETGNIAVPATFSGSFEGEEATITVS